MIVDFVQGPRSTADRNVRAYVEHWRATAPFGPGIDFDRQHWDIPSCKHRASKDVPRLVFSRFASKPLSVRVSAGPRSECWMREPFCSFAKAYLLNRQAFASALEQSTRMKALRALEAALAEQRRSPAIEKLNTLALDRAVQLLKGRFAPLGAYAAGLELEKVAELATTKGLVESPVVWRSPLIRPHMERLGSEFDKRRSELLPSRAALEALPKAFHLVKETRDRISMAAAALQLICHSRICEVLTIPAECEVTVVRERGQRGWPALRWWPAKGADPCLKPILRGFEPVAERALAMAREATEPARRVARWYGRFPKRLYLPPELEHLRGREFVTTREVEAITGLSHARCFVRGLESRSQKGGLKEVRFAEFEAHVLDMLPHDFPHFDPATGLRYGDAMFVVLRGTYRTEAGRGSGVHSCLIDRVSSRNLVGALGGRAHLAQNRESLFERLGLTEDDGSLIQLHTHALRRYLSDLAQRNQVAPLDLAAWAGRSVKSNVAYDYRSEAERVEHIRRALGSRMTWRGPQIDLAKRVPIPRAEFASLVAPTAHTTEIGYCLHDYGGLTCQMHLDCVFCAEHICVKGDKKRTDTVARWLEENSALLEGAKAAMRKEAYGSDRWVAHTEKAVARLRQLEMILHDETIADGTVVQLASPVSPSRLRDAAIARGLLPATPAARKALPARQASARLT